MFVNDTPLGESTDDLAMKKCIPCSDGMPPLSEEKEREYIHQIKGWSLDRKRIHHIRKLFQFPSFSDSINFVNRVAEIAEQEGHHPDIYISFHYVTVSVWTKKIFGLSENDFILAAKVDALTAA